ncbi:bacteriophage V tail protein [Escherichia coli]|nr:bacteriophage V tail protein [Escherichia coli]SQT03787.1 bacteriophage V tail protein [Escherichia coli]SRZ38396.1 bacteriophage V tail protein [Escherichia coli]
MKLILPFPPSVNTYWRHPNKGAFAGKSLISAAGRKFQSAACAAIVEQLRRLPKPTSAPASVEIVLFPPDKRTCASAPLDPLTRAVVISLFTWRRAEPDDNADVPMGWWGDTWPAVQNDRYGSRLWLLQRSKLTNQLVQTVRGYIRECLQWMIDDGVVSRIDLDIRRTGINELGNSITLWCRDGPVMISFDDLWSAITHGGQ